MHSLVEIFPHPSVVQSLSRYFVNLGNNGVWVYYAIQALIFYLLLFLTLRVSASSSIDFSSNSQLKKNLSSNFVFIFGIFALIILARIPTALLGAQNADEAQWIAIAKTLVIDPRFWVSTDGGSGGPITPFTLLLLKTIGLSIDHGSIKLMSGFLMAVSISCLFLFLYHLTGKVISRLVILPLVVAVSIMSYYDMVAYNSEHAVITLLCLALAFFGRLYAQGPGKNYLNIILLGIFLGLIPFAKLQGAPIAIFVGMCGLYIVVRQKIKNSLWILLVSSIAPACFIILLVWAYGGLEYFWLSYVEQNLIYSSRNSIEHDVFSYRINLLLKLLYSAPELTFFINYSLILSLWMLLLIASINPVSLRPTVEKIFFSTVLVIITAYCIVAPNNLFPHYALLLLVPLVVLTGLLLDIAVSASISKLKRFENILRNSVFRVFLSMIFLFSSSFYYFQIHFTLRPSFIDNGNTYYSGYAEHGDLVAVLNHYYVQGERMAIWGWTNSLYESTNFFMGTRFTTAYNQIQNGALRDYFIKIYLEDLNKNKPMIFVETVAPNFFAYTDRSKSGFENYPEVKKYIEENYEFDMEVIGARIYFRKNIGSKKKLWTEKSIIKKSNSICEYAGNLDGIDRSGPMVRFNGWAATADDIHKQLIKVVLFNKTDSLYINCYSTSRKDVVSTLNRPNWIECGYVGLIPINSVPKGDYQLGIYVENEDKICFTNLNRSFNIDL
jgi:hypothetical protein